MPTAQLTMKALYQHVTGDRTAHQRRIDAHLRRQTSFRQNLIARRLKGQSLQEIADSCSTSKGVVQKNIDRACEAIRKAIAGEPRYNRQGHKGPFSKKKRPAKLKPAT